MAKIAHARIDHIILVVFGLLVPIALGSSLTIFNDGDVRWHIATGQWIIDHRAVPRSDPFSSTFYGQPWVAIEWGSEVIFGAAYRLAGFGGVAAVVTAALIAMHLVIVKEARRWTGPLGVAATITLLDLILIPMILARPHVLGWSLLALWFSLLLKAHDAGRAPPLIAAALMVLWVNLHGSFALGLVVAAVVGLATCVNASWSRPVLRGWLLFGIVIALAVLINPYGIDGLLHPLAISNMKILPLIVEWRPSNFSRTPFFYLALGIVALLMAIRGSKLRPVMATLLVVLLAMALMQMRHQAILAIVAAMLLPRALGGAERPNLQANPVRRRLGVLAITAAVAVVVAVRAWLPLVPAENGANPKGAIAALPDDLRKSAGLNGYGFGGPLILEGLKPFIDGRADMYGDDFVIRYRRILDGDKRSFDLAAARYDLRWTMLPPRYSMLITQLDSDPRWERIYADQIAVIHRRR